jgi:hypothetical protein
MRLLALHDHVVAVGGRIVDSQGVVLEAAAVVDRFGRLCSPYRYRRASDGGPYALALKPHCVARVSPHLCFLRASFLFAHARALNSHTDWRPLLDAFCSIAASSGHRLVYSPIIEAVASSLFASQSTSVPAGHNHYPILGISGYAGRHGVPAE